MLKKIKKDQLMLYINQLKDVRMLGLIVFVIIVILVSWSGVNVIQTNYNLEKQVSKIDQENQVQQLINNNIKLQNEYYNTDTYLELKARQQFGKAAQGETAVIIPKNVALSHTVDLPKVNSTIIVSSPQKAKYQKNFEDWINFLTHRQSTD